MEKYQYFEYCELSKEVLDLLKEYYWINNKLDTSNSFLKFLSVLKKR
jgi:hypothetical protein